MLPDRQWVWNSHHSRLRSLPGWWRQAEALGLGRGSHQIDFSCATASSHLLVCAVEVYHVLLVHITGRDVSSTAEPPLAWDAVPLLCFKVSVVEVHGGGKGVPWVHD